MREYGKISPQFWIGPTGKALRKAGTEAQLVALYLMTSPHANMIGLYYLSESSIAHETGLGFEGASKGLQSAIEAGFCRYDADAEVIWVVEMATYQIADELSAKDLLCKGIQRDYASVPENKYLAEFFDKYYGVFHMTKCRGAKAPSKPLRSQEQEQEQEQEHDAAAQLPPVGDTKQQHHADMILTDTNATEFAKAVMIEYTEVWLASPPLGFTLMAAIQKWANIEPKARRVSWWRWYFEVCAEDDYLAGRKDIKFRADILYLIRDDQFTRMVEHGRRAAS
jgi:hypothetical protein